MANEQVTGYIKSIIAKGGGIEEARTALLGQGWDAAQVEESIQVVRASMPAQSTQATKPKKGTMLPGLLVVLAIVVVGSGGYAYWYYFRGGMGTSDTPVVELALPTPEPATVIGTPATVDNLTVSVLSFTHGPDTTGDAAAAGNQYAEIVMTVANKSTESKTLTSSQFTYKTAAGQEIKPLNVATADDGTTKDVTLDGKEVLDSATFSAGDSSAVSLLFEIPTNDTGTLIWKDSALADAKVLASFPLK